jgi:serine phosphatase RsbU (regulator of sigma subunit)
MGAPKHKTTGVAKKSELGFSASVIAGERKQAQRLAGELEQVVDSMLSIEVGGQESSALATADVLFIDAETPGLEELLTELDRSARAVYLIVREGAEVPALLISGQVDDVLVHPFRGLEVLSKLRQYQRSLDYQEIVELNESYSQVVEKLQSNLELAARLQKSKLPLRFPDVRGFKITSRYLAGVRPGGDYADLAESRDGNQLAIVLTDASSYRLSSAVLDALPRVMGKVSIEDARSCIGSARRIRDGVLATLTEQDRLSLFYAILSRKDYKLRFVNLGTSRAFYASPGKPFEELTTQGDAIQRASGVRVRVEEDGEVTLEPEGRLAIFSDGFVQIAGGAAKLIEILNRFRGADPKDSINELAFRVKSPLTSEDDLPARDCTAVIFDVDSRLIRLA